MWPVYYIGKSKYLWWRYLGPIGLKKPKWTKICNDFFQTPQKLMALDFILKINRDILEFKSLWKIKGHKSWHAYSCGEFRNSCGPWVYANTTSHNQTSHVTSYHHSTDKHSFLNYSNTIACNGLSLPYIWFEIVLPCHYFLSFSLLESHRSFSAVTFHMKIGNI